MPWSSRRRNYWRTQLGGLKPQPHQAARDAPAAGQCLVGKEQVTLPGLLAAVARLSPAHRRVLLLRHWARMPAIEIAVSLGLSPMAVQLLHLRAVRELSHVLRDTAPLG